LTTRIYAKVHDRILDELDQAKLPSEDDDALLADYGIWVKRRREETA